MKRVLIMIAVVLAAFAARPMADEDSTALCPVCALSGETEPHGVAATREYQGRTYSFCAKACANSFDEDPAAYIFAPGPAPDITLKSVAGKPAPVVQAGRVTVVDFWATWCKPCRKTMPELDALYREFEGRGVAVIGISTDTGKDREKKVKKFLSKNPVSYPVAMDREESPAWEAYHVKILSTVFLVDQRGVIVKRWTGEIGMDEVRRAVEDLLAGKDVDGPDGSGS
jgi:thiol-disulfide isomerase/thioredoxin